MGVQFIHLLALSIWVGGIFILSAIVTPVLHQRIPSQHLASTLISDIFRKFDKVVVCCASALVITALIKFLKWENLTPWNLIRYMAIFIMCSVCLYSLTPISKTSRKSMASQAMPLATSPETDSPPLILVTLVCGVTAILMA